MKKIILEEKNSIDDFERALEKVNSEYIRLISSEEYKMGKIIVNNPNAIIRYLIKEKARRLKSKLINNNDIGDKKVFYSKGGYVDDICKCIVYTCVTNRYDPIVEPIYVSSKMQYIYFTDDKSVSDDQSAWEIRHIDRGNSINLNRYYKLNPFEVLKDCDFSIYVDGNIQIVSDIRPLCADAHNSKVGIAMHMHSSRKCVYKEGDLCIRLGRGNRARIREQMKRYRDEGFPEQFGLYEAPIIVVDHYNRTAKEIMKLWWEEFERSGSERDQLSLPYCMWKLGFNFDDIGCLGNDVNYNPKFRKTYIHFAKEL